MGTPQHFSNLVILHLPAYEDERECSETSAFNIQTPGNYPDESIKHSEHGESFKSRIHFFICLETAVVRKLRLVPLMVNNGQKRGLATMGADHNTSSNGLPL